MIAQEAVYLNKEIKRLNKYGIEAIVVPDGNKYNILLKESKECIEPYCSPTEVLGIINSIENVVEYMKRKKYEKH